MSDLLSKCTVCGAVLDEEDLFCSECGTESPLVARENRAGAPATRLSTHNFVCQGCGASMSYDASVHALRCPFCGSEQLSKQADSNEIAPSAVLPFEVPRDQAQSLLREWLRKGFWRPGDLAQAAEVVKMQPVYVPYWVFEAKTHTYWTADTSRTPFGARGDWYPLFGEHHGAYADVLVGGSTALTPAETSALCPFNCAAAKPPSEVDLENITFERFAVQRKYARPLARSGLESLEIQAIGPTVPGRQRNLKVNTRITDLVSRPMLLPVWIMAYRYQDDVFRFLINGQTGRATGKAPVSWRKIVAAISIAAVVLLVILLIVAASAGR
jgi:predicted RNA-binding Zn-ribbon protein involved in translation (DUF1610 family)